MIRRKANRVTRKRKPLNHLEALESRNLLAGDPLAMDQPLVITEILADNATSLTTRTRSSMQDGFGNSDTPDWIEILNISGEPLDLGGMHLTDDETDPTKWEFPAGTSLGAGEFMIVFASGEDITDTKLDEHGNLHSNFRLGANGEYLAVTNRDGSVIHEFAPTFAGLRTDISYAVPTASRTLLATGSEIQYLIPSDNSVDDSWPSTDFPADGFQAGVSPIGYDRGDAPPEEGPTIGAEIIDRSSADFGSGSINVLVSMPFDEVGRVSAWSFYSDKSRPITPLVFRQNGDDLEITGIGQTRLSDASGGQTYTFELQSGSDVVQPGYFFGFKDGDNVSDSPGTADYATNRDETVRRFNGPLSGSMVVGETLSGGREFGRIFSVQATTSPTLQGPIATDLGDSIADSSSAYVRYPFSVEQIDSIQTLTLDIRYDDGFVAYLNGTEVARRNAPADPAFDSIATENQPLRSANLYEEINISSSVGLLMEGQNVLAIQSLNDMPGGSELFLDASLRGLDISTAENVGFAAQPTPGGANGIVLADFVGDIQFSQGRGLYDEAIQLELTSETADVTIFFTTDGTPPTPENPTANQYTAPLDIAGTTVLRAAGFRDDLLPSATVTHSYVLPNDVKMQESLLPHILDVPEWGSRFTDALRALPTVSVVTAEEIGLTGEFPTSVEMIYTDGSEFQVDAGIESFGGTAISFPKRSMRISFKNIYGPSIFEYDVFDDADGVQRFDQLLLRPGSQDAPFWDATQIKSSYIRNRWASDRQLEMGQPGTRGQFVHLYLNGDYVGQWHLMERPNAAFMAENFGGDKDDYDVLNKGVPVDGDAQAWQELLSVMGDDYEEIEKRLDVVNYADYVLLQFFAGNRIDWRHDANWMAARRRPDGKFLFFAWDNDMMLRIGPHTDIVNYGGPGFLWTLNGGLRQYPEFLDVLAERAAIHFADGGALSDQRLQESMDAFIEELSLPIIAETARWGFDYTPNDWLGAIDDIKTLYTGRGDVVMEQMRHAGLIPLASRPEFEVNGVRLDEDQVEANSPLTIQRVDEQETYYTLDGSDPRSAWPTVERTSLVAESSMARIFVPPSEEVGLALGNTWQATAFDDAEWLAGQNGIGYDAQTPQPDDPTYAPLTPFINTDIEQEMKGVNASAYMRFSFEVDDPAQFDTLEFSLQYNDGFIAYLNGVRVARRFAPNPRGDADRNGVFDSADLVSAFRYGEFEDDVPFNSQWWEGDWNGDKEFDSADLVAALTEPVFWNSSASRTHANVESVVFEGFNLSREIGLLKPGKNVLAIQALNRGADNLSMLMTPTLHAGKVTDKGLSPAAILYSGETIDVGESGAVNARTIAGNQWSPLRTVATRSEPFPIRISEIMYHPAAPSDAEVAAGFTNDDDFEYIELTNISGATVDLSNVQLVQTVSGNDLDGVRFDFATDNPLRQLAAGQSVLVVENTSAFTTRYGNQLPVAGAWSGGLGNNSEKITLLANGRTLLEVTYDDDWYPETDGDGASLEIIDVFAADLGSWSHQAAWRPSMVLGGTPGQMSIRLAGDVNGDGAFDSSDLVLVQQSGLFEDGISNNATFDQGDWNGDGDFDTTDLVFVLQMGHYSSAAAAVVAQPLGHDDFDLTRPQARLAGLAAAIEASDSFYENDNEIDALSDLRFTN